jgi:hypothetical protein
MKVVVMNKENMSIKNDAALEVDYVAIDNTTGKLSLLHSKLADTIDDNYDAAIETLNQHNASVHKQGIEIPISDYIYMM